MCVLVSNKPTRIVDHVWDHRTVDVPLPHLRGQEQATVHNFKNLFLPNGNFSILLKLPNIVAGQEVGQGLCTRGQPQLRGEVAKVLLRSFGMVLILSKISTYFTKRGCSLREPSISIWAGVVSMKLRKEEFRLKKEPFLDTISMSFYEKFIYFESHFFLVMTH